MNTETDSPLTRLLTPRVCELGKIKIGGKGAEKTGRNGNKYRIPAKYDHFIITTLNRSAAGDLEMDGQLMAKLRADGFADKDGKIRSLPIYVLSNELDDIMQSAYVWYVGKRIGARGDMNTVTWYINPKTGLDLQSPETRKWDEDNPLEKTDSKGVVLPFKLFTTFSCVIGSTEGRWGGVYKFRTTSVITANQLYGSLVHLKALTGGQLTGMPLNMVVRPMQVAPAGATTTVYVVHIELRGKDLAQIQETARQIAEHEYRARKQIQSTQREYRKLLAAPGTETDEREIQHIPEEFVPESVEVVDQVTGEVVDMPAGAAPPPGTQSRLSSIVDATRVQHRVTSPHAEPEPTEPVTEPVDDYDPDDTI